MPDELAPQVDLALARAKAAIAAAAGLDALEEAKVTCLGRKGSITELLGRIGSLPAEMRSEFGKRANEAKQELTRAIEERRQQIIDAELLPARDFDPTTPGPRTPRGHFHPVIAMRREIEDIFVSMGFLVLEGPEVETEEMNFDALNIPGHHPARDMQDTFFIETPPGVSQVLRTHTSPMQVRAMRKFGAPLRAIVPGRVYRNETIDASHECAFHQVEGLVVDVAISVAHLKGTLQAFLGSLFGADVVVRLRPHYFPFVEPGFELDFRCMLCSGSGCALCKRTGWIELLGCGMVHPRVLEAGGIDPERYSGFAFGVGIDRLAMMRHGIEDIRHFNSGDLRFFSQF